MREFVLSHSSIIELVELPDKVFEDATVNTGIVVLEKESNSGRRDKNVVEIVHFDEAKKTFKTLRQIPQGTFKGTYKNVFDTSLSPEIFHLKAKVVKNATELGHLLDVRFGLKTGDDEKFISRKHLTKKHKPLLRGENVQRYSFEFNGEYVWYVPEKMRVHRQTARPGEPERFEQPKILIKDTSSKLGGTLDVENFYVKDVLILTKKPSVEVSLPYILGVLNSSLMRFYYESTFPTLHVQNEELSSLPIRTIDFTNPAEKQMHDELVALVEKMLELHKQLHGKGGAHLKGGVHLFESEKEPIQRQIAATDKRIDELVYRLYSLTEEEIRIVEG